MKLFLRLLPVALALLMPSVALAEGGKPSKAHGTHAAHAKAPKKSTKAKAPPKKATKATKPKASKKPSAPPAATPKS